VVDDERVVRGTEETAGDDVEVGGQLGQGLLVMALGGAEARAKKSDAAAYASHVAAVRYEGLGPAERVGGVEIDQLGSEEVDGLELAGCVRSGVDPVEEQVAFGLVVGGSVRFAEDKVKSAQHAENEEGGARVAPCGQLVDGSAQLDGGLAVAWSRSGCRTGGAGRGPCSRRAAA
jgi:hypothetical protein